VPGGSRELVAAGISSPFLRQRYDISIESPSESWTSGCASMKSALVALAGESETPLTRGAEFPITIVWVWRETSCVASATYTMAYTRSPRAKLPGSTMVSCRSPASSPLRYHSIVVRSRSCSGSRARTSSESASAEPAGFGVISALSISGGAFS